MTKFIILILLAAACRLEQKEKSTGLAIKDFKDSFLFHNLNLFKFDSVTLKNLRVGGKWINKFAEPTTPYLTRIIGKNHYLLYSWQQNTSRHEFDFVVITATHLDEGYAMRYLKVDSKDSILSDNIIAQWNSDPGDRTFERFSEIGSGDTILLTRSSSYMVDQRTLAPLSKPIGDTMWFQQVLGKRFDSDKVLLKSKNTTENFKDSNGWITEKSIH